MQSIFSIEIIYKDETLVEIGATVSNGRYSGVTTVYASKEDLIDLGRKLIGFPKDLSQVVEEYFGDFDSYSYLNLKFRCIDNMGHVGVEVTMQDNLNNAVSEGTRSRLFALLLLEPAGLDEFAKSLVLMGETEQGFASIKVS